MAIPAALKSASLDDAFDEAIKAGRTLREQLRVFETESRALIAGGSIQSVSASGGSTSFATAGAGQITPMEWVELWRELITLHDKNASAGDDAAIKAAMLATLATSGFSESYPDFSYMRA